MFARFVRKRGGKKNQEICALGQKPPLLPMRGELGIVKNGYVITKGYFSTKIQ